MTSTNHPLFQQPYKCINLFGQVQPSVMQLLTIDFLSNGKEPCHTQSHSERKCGYVEREYESSTLFLSPCAYCMKKYFEENEAEDWLKFLMCHQWFHEKCFKL